MKVIQFVIVFEVLVLFSNVSATTLPGGWVVSWGGYSGNFVATKAAAFN